MLRLQPIEWSSRIWPPLLLGLVVLSTAIWLYGASNPVVQSFRERLEWVAYDLRMQLLLPEHVEHDPRILIVDIDEKSLKAEGHWPWQRRKITHLVQRLFDAGAAVVGFDIVFAEAERNPALDILDQAGNDLLKERPGLEEGLRGLAQALDADEWMASELAGQPLVLGYAFLVDDKPSAGALPNAIAEVADEQLSLRQFPSFVGNLPVLQEQVGSAGFFMVDPDEDGVIRRASLIARHGDGVYASLSIAMANLYLGSPPTKFTTARVGDHLVIEEVSLGDFVRIPLDGGGNAVVPYVGKRGSFRYVSATDVLHGTVAPETVQDTLVLIGTTATGLFDLRATPLEGVFPGVEIHANLLRGILDEAFPYITTWAEGLDIVMLLVVGLFCALVFPYLRASWLIGVSLSLMVGYTMMNVWFWSAERIILSLALPLLVLVFLTVINLAWGYVFESRSKNRLKGMFGQYVPPTLVEEMSRNSSMDFGFEGESREMTVVFCDIRGFTTLSETLTPTELKKLLNFFFTPMTQVIFDHRGTIDKYVGDMIMAFWGAPLRDDLHREHGVAAALEMLKKVEELAAPIAERGWPPVRIGVGLNSGSMNVGDMGSTYRRNYTVLGDAVNLGSRLEGLTKAYGVNLIISEFTREGQTGFLFRLLDRVRVKGKQEAVSIFEPICALAEVTPELTAEVAAHHQALGHYFSRRWDEAEAGFRELKGQRDRYMYGVYLERIPHLRAEDPGPAWDGAFTFTTK